MENLNAEQVKKALSVCWDTTCSDCEFDSNCGGHWQVLENAFALINSYEQKIKELTEDLHATRTELTRVQEENERLRVDGLVEALKIVTKITAEMLEGDGDAGE